MSSLGVKQCKLPALSLQGAFSTIFALLFAALEQSFIQVDSLKFKYVENMNKSIYFFYVRLKKTPSKIHVLHFW